MQLQRRGSDSCIYTTCFTCPMSSLEGLTNTVLCTLSVEKTVLQGALSLNNNPASIVCTQSAYKSLAAQRLIHNEAVLRLKQELLPGAERHQQLQDFFIQQKDRCQDIMSSAVSCLSSEIVLELSDSLKVKVQVSGTSKEDFRASVVHVTEKIFTVVEACCLYENIFLTSFDDIQQLVYDPALLFSEQEKMNIFAVAREQRYCLSPNNLGSLN